MYITDFSNIQDINQDGGKGHNLKRLVSFGFNVPDGFVIGASFYREHYKEPPDFAYDDEEKLEAQCSSMRDAVISANFPYDVENRIFDFLKVLGLDGTYAVRSSSTFEDLASAAFAGQHETFLNITAQDVLSKVKLCHASLWQKHAVLYRWHLGFDQKNASMAVVVQRMVDPCVAGVAFSVDPVGGNLAHLLIEANYGLGESVVGGEAVTDSWIVDKNTLQVLERRISKKEHKVIMDTDGGVRDVPVECGMKEVPCLEDGLIVKIAQTIKGIETSFGSPQDVEWAVVSDDLFITQSRPQTKIPPHFTRAESAERFPEPLTPLTWSYVEEAFNVSLDYSLDMMGITLPTRPWFTLINSYVYGNQNAVELLTHFRPLDMSSLKRLEEQVSEMKIRFQWLIDLPQYWMRDLDTYLIRIGKLSAVSFDGFTMDDYQKFCRELSVTATEYFKPNIAISMTQALLTRTLFEYSVLLTGDFFKAQDLVKRILTSSGTKTGQINREIFGLSRLALREKGLMNLLEKGSREALLHLGDFKEFSAAFERFLLNYGHREVTFDYYKPTWAEAPHVVLDLILLTATSEMSDPAEKDLDARVASAEALQELLAHTPENLRYFVTELVRMTASFTWLDDLEHFQTTRINLIVRKTVGALGKRMKEKGYLSDAHDLFFLKKTELENLHDYSIPEGLLETIRMRKDEYEAAFRREPEWDLNMLDQGNTVGSDSWKGVPGSPGTVEGEVYLVTGVEDFPHMPAGAIMVAKTTNPSWTPLFYRSKGLITESGGPLSHGAVTARELGLPAVMFIRNAMSIFKNGDRVCINGQRGEVTRLQMKS